MLLKKCQIFFYFILEKMMQNKDIVKDIIKIQLI